MNNIQPLKEYLEKLNIYNYSSSKVMKFNVPILGYKLSKDVLDNSYWEVNASSWDKDVMEQFNKGNIILNHTIHSVSLIMPISTFEKYLKHPQTVIYKDVMDWFKVERQIEEMYQNRSNDIEKTKVLAPGYIFGSPVADGYANYIVTKVTKASVFYEHLSFGDAYQCQIINSFGGKMSRNQFDKISFFGRNMWGAAFG